MRRPVLLAVVLAASFAVTAPASAQAPIQLALFSPIQIFPPETSIHGVRLSLIYGDNRDMLGFDLGLVTRTRGRFAGYQLGVVGMVEGDLIGWQNNWIVNYVGGEAMGVQTSVVNLADELAGAALGVVNVSRDVEGFTFGAVNLADEMSGFALGLVNYAVRLHGVQIGIVNIAANGVLPVMPIVNWAFD